MTSGYELGTAITNILIFIVSIIIYFKKDYNDRLWKRFFFCLIFDSLLGVIIHGIVMSELTKLILWIILSLIFSVTINILLTIFLKDYKQSINNKNSIYLTIFLYTIIVIEYILKIDFLNTFIIYACICMLIILLISIIKYKDTRNKKYIYYILGIVSQIIGGIFLIVKIYHIDFLLLDKNGLYHLFMILTIIFFYKGILKK